MGKNVVMIVDEVDSSWQCLIYCVILSNMSS